VNHHDASAPAAVELGGVTKWYDGKVILDGVDLSLPRGEFLALVGPSGSGKSTLLRMVSGIDVPDAGKVWLQGKEVTHEPPYRRPVHTVFQNYALFPHLTVAGNVDFPLRVAGVPRAERDQRVRQALNWVKLDEFAERRIDQLSGGQQQRVALARALVKEPQCVLLDEPLAALDMHLRGHTLQLLQELQARLGLTYLYVTHDREEALRAAHRIGILRGGRLEQLDTPEEVYHRPRTAFVAEFMGPINWLRGVVEASAGRPGLRLPGGHWTPLPTKTTADAGSLRLGVRPAHVRLCADGGLPVRVAGRQFRGDTILLHLTDETGVNLHAEMRTDGSPPGQGELVRAAWAVEAVHVFSDQDTP
jgi:ABC-type Fe3+/spermidine/putrescine transport system ATPase subunit